MTPLRRRAVAPVAVVIASTLALVGCAGGGSGSTGAAPDGVGLPKGDELAAWADGVISENQLGGADYAVRATGSFDADAEVGIDISALDGAGTLSLACLTDDGSTASLVVDAPGDGGTETLACGSVDDPSSGTTAQVPVSDAAALTLTASAPGVFVYAVTPTGGVR